jgi:hypothetical protein
MRKVLSDILRIFFELQTARFYQYTSKIILFATSLYLENIPNIQHSILDLTLY